MTCYQGDRIQWFHSTVNLGCNKLAVKKILICIKYVNWYRFYLIAFHMNFNAYNKFVYFLYNDHIISSRGQNPLKCFGYNKSFDQTQFLFYSLFLTPFLLSDRF